MEDIVKEMKQRATQSEKIQEEGRDLSDVTSVIFLSDEKADRCKKGKKKGRFKKRKLSKSGEKSNKSSVIGNWNVNDEEFWIDSADLPKMNMRYQLWVGNSGQVLGVLYYVLSKVITESIQDTEYTNCT